MRQWRFSEKMTEYLDELICLFRQAKPGTLVSFQDKEVKNRLLAGLPAEALGEIEGFLYLSAAGIARKYDLIHSQREALGITTLVAVEKPLNIVQEKQTRGDDLHTYREFKQIFAFRDGNRLNRFKDETCSYCNKKGHNETVCFAKRDNDKLTKMAAKVSAAKAEQIATTNKQAMAISQPI